jgi:RNA polymerase subunit RPABC4/transcription elongation factor Spt4
MAMCNWCGDKDTTDIWKSHICIEDREREIKV